MSSCGNWFISLLNFELRKLSEYRHCGRGCKLVLKSVWKDLKNSFKKLIRFHMKCFGNLLIPGSRFKLLRTKIVLKFLQKNVKIKKKT